MSGHKVSDEKTVIYFSPNVEARTRKEICNRSKFRQVEEIGRYLGADIKFTRRRRDKYKSIVDRVGKRLKGWKAASLSLAGRITLVKSVTGSMAIYPMQHDCLPQGIIDEIDRLQRNFVWGETEGKKVWHPIVWEKMCKPKIEGGVGIKSLKLMNESFLLKLLWRLHTDPTDLWVQVILGKYGRKWREEGQMEAKKADSRLWKELVKSEEKFEQSIHKKREVGREEVMAWKHTGHGEFTTASAYKWLQGQQNMRRNKMWKHIWKLKVPERVRVFMWRCSQKIAYKRHYE